MQNTDNMENWTYPSDEKMKEIEDLLNNEMTFNLGIKMFSEEFSIFTREFIPDTSNIYFRYSSSFGYVVKKLLSKYKRNYNELSKFKFVMESSIRANLFYIFP